MDAAVCGRTGPEPGGRGAGPEGRKLPISLG